MESHGSEMESHGSSQSLADNIQENHGSEMESHGSSQSLADNIQDKISRAPEYSPACCIHRVPPLLRLINEQAYTPALVSIGPLHHNNNDRLVPMEAHKHSHLRSFLHHSSHNADLNSYLGIVKDMETKIRECYAVPIHLSSDDFIQMVLIDSAFIIQLFRWVSGGNDDRIMYKAGYFSLAAVERDIKLEENQLPLFVLIRLYRAAFKPSESDDEVPCFTDLACKILKVKKSKVCLDDRTNEATCYHLLDLVRSNYKPTPTHPRAKDPDHVTVRIHTAESMVCPTATSLYAAGVKFQVIPTDDNSSNLLDICFDKDKGILSIPKLLVEDKTECLFRNLIAFEQCQMLHTPDALYLTNYQYLLDQLIDTPEDVKLLAKAGIIHNWLGSDNQVSNLINSLCNNTSLNSSAYTYQGITRQLNDHHNKRWNQNRAILKQKYFQHPWAAISLIYAAILLLLTLVQVVAGILAIPH